MLHETRNYIEDNFEIERALTGHLIYQKKFSGYWKIVLAISLNWVDIMMDRMFEKYMLNISDVNLSKKVLRLYAIYGKKYSRLLCTQKIKPKRLNAKEFAILVDKVRDMDANFATDMKKLLTEYRANKVNEDF